MRVRGRKEAGASVVVGVLAAAGVLAALQATILLPLVSELPEIYAVGPVGASWIITATTLAGALSTPVVSRAADMYGKRRLIVATLVVLAAGSVMLATTDAYAVAVVGRVLQGVTAALIPVAMSILKDVLPSDRVGSAVALVSATMGMGAAVGLPLSGLMFARLGLASIFWCTAVLAVALAGAAVRLLPASTLDGERDHFDWCGAGLLATTLSSLLLVLSQCEQWGWGSAAVVLATIGSIASFAAWVAWELRVRHPLVDIRLALRRPVLLTNAATVVIAFGMLANLILAAYQYGSPAELEVGLGLSAGATGIAMAIPAGLFVLTAPLLGTLLRRFGGRYVLLAGSLVMAVAYVLRIFLDGSVVQVTVGAILVGAGCTLALAATPVIIMGSVPQRHTASANGVNSLCRMLGISTSMAVLAALTSATSQIVAGTSYPTAATLHTACWLFAAAAAVASALVWFVPRDDGVEPTARVPRRRRQHVDTRATGRGVMYATAEQ